MASWRIELTRANPIRFSWVTLSGSPYINVVRQCPNVVDWARLRVNDVVFGYLADNPRMKWSDLSLDNVEWVGEVYWSENPVLLDILDDDDILALDVLCLFGDINVLNKLSQYQYCHNWRCLSFNPSAMDVLLQNQSRIVWSSMSGNPAAVNLLRDNPHLIDWHVLSGNPAAISILEVNLDKVVWSRLSRNPAALHLLEKNPHMIDWYQYSQNLSLPPLTGY